MTANIPMMKTCILLLGACLSGNVLGAGPVSIESLLTEMTDRDSVARFPETDFRLRQQSSYDRLSKTPDDPKGWFANKDNTKNFIRVKENGGRKEWVLMEDQGAGAIVRSWMPWRGQTKPSTTSIIRFYLDGAEEPALEANMLELFQGKDLVPFPLAHKSLRSAVSYFPIPYAKGSKVTVSEQPFFFVFTCREYPDGTPVDVQLDAKTGDWTWDDRSMYFNAAWRGQYPVPIQAAKQTSDARPRKESPQLARDKPNVVVIMADDLGYADVGCYGCRDIPTPHIDKLAEEGVRFTSGYVTWPMCGPSRAGFLTGRYQSTFGYYQNPSLPFDPKQGLPKIETIAGLLQDQGYATGGVGKWHMGTSNDQHPNAMGFDDWFGFLSGGLMYYPLDHPSYKGRFTPLKRPAKWRDIHHTLPVIHNMEPVAWDQYLTRELTDAGIAFLEKNQKNPFFLFMSYNAPHLDLEAPEETIAKFPLESMTKVPGVKPTARSIYGAMVYEMDQGVGQLVAKLNELGLAENTVVWFLSDNGGMGRTSDNRPLKGAKGSPYEGGLRVPMIVKWHGKAKAGAVLDEAVTSLDIGATTIAMAGGDPVGSGLHGKDIRPYITQQSNEAPHDVLYWHTGRAPGPIGVIRDGDFKLIITKGKAGLYDLKNDLGETTDLAASQPERVQELLARWKEWNHRNKPALWGKPEKEYQYAHYEWLKGSQHYKAKSD